MISPVYCNQVEINTIHSPIDGDLVELRFFYSHPKMDAPKTDFPNFPLTMGPNVIMPRAVAKDMLRIFLTFMASQDEKKPGPVPELGDMTICPVCKVKWDYTMVNGKEVKWCDCNKKKEGTTGG